MRLHAPAAERNRDALLQILRGVLPPRGVVLEVASGSGQHVVHFAAALEELTFVPSDLDADARQSIDAWVAHEELRNVRPAVGLDTRSWPWPISSADAVVCSNMIHIAPWEACLGLLEGAGKLLRSGAPLALYGPFRRAGEHTAPSNAAFDADLRRRDVSWGVRDLEQIEAHAEAFTLDHVHQMPANNLTVVFRRH